MNAITAKLKYLVIMAPLLLVALLIISFILSRNGGGGDGVQPKHVSLTYWGLFEPAEVMTPLIESYTERYKEQHPESEIEIKYEQRFFDSLEQYKETLLNRLNAKTGPDIMRFHVTWVPQFQEELAPLPSEIMDSTEYSEVFYPVAVENVTIGGNIYAIPLMYEGLVMLVNVDIFNEAGLAVPSISDRITWGEFEDLAVKLTETDENGRITQAGAAIGLSRNIPHASDILGLMWAQSDITSVANMDTPEAQIVLDFYTAFVRENKVWNASFSSSIKAFAEGKVAMIFAPSWRVFDIKNMNPGLDFTVSPVPQIPGKEDVNWASFWVEGVSLDSPFQDVAWDFLNFLAAQDTQKSFYSLASQVRKEFGEPYSRVDLADNLSSHKFLGPLLAQAATAQTWIITDYSGNKPYVEIINNAITAVAEDGSSSSDVLKNAKGTLEPLLIQNRAILR